MYNNIFGIDVSKKDFVVACHGTKETKSYPNTTVGHKSFIKKNKSLLQDSLVVVENTGGYEESLVLSLLSKNISVHKAPGRQIKRFIESYGKYAKTDKVDALLIAKYGFERHDSLTLYKVLSNNYLQLKDAVNRRIELVQMLVQEKNRSKRPLKNAFSKSTNRVIKFLEKEIELVEKFIEKLAKENKDFSQKREVLQEVEGIGKINSVVLLALVPELGTTDRRSIASLCGVAPHPRQSGTINGHRNMRGGRYLVRSILFTSAMGASRSKGRLGKWYRSLKEREKKPKVALGALMRKIIVVSNAKLKDRDCLGRHCERKRGNLG